MAGNFEIDVNGSTAAIAGIKADADRAKKVSQRIVVGAAKDAADLMRVLAPRGSYEKDEIAYDTIHSRVASDKTALYVPGGAGGGGTWTARAGVKRSVRYPDPDHDPASLVTQGTGLYGPNPHMIYPRAGNLMVFKYEGKWWRMRWMKGQEPQTDWVERAQDRANAAVKAAVAMFAERMKRTV